jgi:hypothetical protein
MNYKNDIKSVLQQCCNQTVGRTGVSSPGGQGRKEATSGGKQLEQELLGTGPNKATILWGGGGGGGVGKVPGVKYEILAGTKHGRHYLGVTSR